MSFNATTLKRHFFTLFLLVAIAVPAWPQDQPQPPARPRPVLFNNSDGIVASLVNAPSFSSSAASSDNPLWLKVEFHYSVTPKPEQGPFLPSLTIKVWIEGRDLYDPQGKPGEGIAVVLTGSVKYVNLAAGRDVYGSLYVHPGTLARYSTSNGSTDFGPDGSFNIHAEADVDGQESDYYDKKKEDDLDWYKKPKAVDGLVLRQNQCPFMMDSPGHYPAILLEGASSSSAAVGPTPDTGPVKVPAPAPPPTPAP